MIEKTKQADAILELRRQKESPESRRRGSPAKRILKKSVLEKREKLYQSIRILHNKI